MHSALALALAATPLSSAVAENINIYGWQNWSYEFIDVDGAAGSRLTSAVENPGLDNQVVTDTYEFIDRDGSREYDRLSNNAANIGFMAHMDTGIPGLQVGLRCEQFTYWGRANVYTDWCNRNSKISLRHETMGEIMFGQWLLPYNEIVAAWVDPFYDAGADSHTSIMGNIGGYGVVKSSQKCAIDPETKKCNKRPGDDGKEETFEHDVVFSAGGGLAAAFYNGSFDDAFSSAYGALSFNRRQEGIIQYVWPNTSAMADQSRDGFQFRFAMTEGSATDNKQGDDPATEDENESSTVDPRIISTGVSWQQNLANGGQIWLAAAYEEHEDLSITDLGTDLAATCNDSDDRGVRLAGRYIHDWGNGQKTQLAVMWEELDYDADGCDLPKSKNDEEELVPVSYVSPDYLSDKDGNRIALQDRGEGYFAPWVDVERDAWMVSGKHTFGNGFDFRFSYMDADDVDLGTSTCMAVVEGKTVPCARPAGGSNTGAEAYNLGLYYTMPAGTELRLTYSEVDNDSVAAYDFGINGGGGVGIGNNDVEMIAVGIVHWFD